jgi:hypothetical protein
MMPINQIQGVSDFNKKLYCCIQIPREAFEYTIDQVNAFFDDAEQINCKNTLESMLSYLTCTLINICRKNQMEKVGRVNNFIKLSE